ncbi:hypothetical protein [Pantoea agglomerans]
MKMEAPLGELSLYQLLCLRVFSKTFEVIGLDEYCKAITEWAERKVIAGEESDILLILASLNLDPVPDRYEVEKYLLFYQKEQNIQDPTPNHSALAWLRMKLLHLITASTTQDVEIKLAFFTHYFFDYQPRSFAIITNTISSFYWELYDEAIPAFNSRASQMSENELLDHVKERMLPYYRILDNPDWMWVLTR